MLDYKLNVNPSLLGLIFRLLVLRYKINHYTLEELNNFPIMTDPSKLLMCQVATALTTASYKGAKKTADDDWDLYCF